MRISKKLLASGLGFATLVLALLALPNHHHTTPPPLIDREVFFGNPAIARGSLSPDGRYLAFLKPHQGVVNVWVKPRSAPFEQAQLVTSSMDRPVRIYTWSRDGKYILYMMDSGGDENFHLMAVDPLDHSKPARDLTPYPGVLAELIDLPETHPGRAIVALNDRDARYHDLYWIDIATAERTLIHQNDQQIAGWHTDHEGRFRLATRINESGGTELLNVGPEGLTCLLRCTKEESITPVVFHKDNRRIYISSNIGADRSYLALLDTATGVVEQLESDPEQAVDLSSVLFSKASKELVATTYVGDTERIYFTNPEWEQDFALLRKRLPDGEITLLSSTDDEQLWLIAVRSDRDPEQAFLFNRLTKEVSPLYRAFPDLPSDLMAPMVPISYTSRDGLTIHGYLTLPKGMDSAKTPLPMVVMPHGGPNHRDMWGYNGYAQFFANRGYACLQMNFRGSTGFGKAFVNAGNKQWGDAMQNDISDGVLYCIQKGIADPKRVAIFGGSYGGYAALAGLAFTPHLYAAGISFVGPSNLITLLQTIPPYWSTAKGLEDERVGNLDNPEDVVRLKRQSPLFSAHAITAPLLVVQGANDPRVKRAESDQIVSALQNLGRPVEYLVAPDEGHGFACRENRLAFAAAAERFLAAHIGGRYQASIPEPVANRLKTMTVVGSPTSGAP